MDSVLEALTRKTLNWPQEIATAFMADMPEGVADRFARSRRSLPSFSDTLTQFANRSLRVEQSRQAALVNLGRVTKDQRLQVGATDDFDLTGYQFILDRSAVRHVMRSHGNYDKERQRGQLPIDVSDFANLPEILDGADQIRLAGRNRLGNPLVTFTKIVNGIRFFATFEVRGRKRRTIALQSMWARSASSDPSA